MSEKDVPVQEPKEVEIHLPESAKKRKGSSKTKCLKCGGTDIYKEEQTSKQWIKGHEEVWSGTRLTCLNLECGYSWRK